MLEGRNWMGHFVSLWDIIGWMDFGFRDNSFPSDSFT
jgi:hypothetical protein